jgi:Phosphopantetheine attachment site
MPALLTPRCLPRCDAARLEPASGALRTLRRSDLAFKAISSKVCNWSLPTSNVSCDTLHDGSGRCLLASDYPGINTRSGSRTSAGEIAPQTYFTDLGGDSISVVTFANVLNEICDVGVASGFIVSPATDLQEIANFIQAERESRSHRATAAVMHGVNATVLHARDLTLDKFIDAATIAGARTLSRPDGRGNTVLLTGATRGFWAAISSWNGSSGRHPPAASWSAWYGPRMTSMRAGGSTIPSTAAMKRCFDAMARCLQGISKFWPATRAASISASNPRHGGAWRTASI